MTDLPSSWAWAETRDLAAPEPGSLTDGPFGSNLKTEHYVAGPGPRVIRLQNIGDGVFRGEDRAFITNARFESLRRHDARSGDVLIAALGETLPRACLVPANFGQAIVKADCFRLRPARGVSPRFLQHILNAPQTHRAASTLISGVGRPRLNLGKVGDLTIPVAPTAEQERVVAAIDEHFSRLDAAVTALERVRQNLKLMRSAVLQDVFGLAKAPDAPGCVSLQTIVTSSIGGAWGQATQLSSDSVQVTVVRGAEFRQWKARRAADAPRRWMPSKQATSRVLEIGDLVLEVSGGGPDQPVGRIVLVDETAIQLSPTTLVASNFCRRLRLDPRARPRFVEYQLAHVYESGGTIPFQKATTNIHNLTVPDYLSKTSVWLPDLAVQDRVVSTLDQSLSAVDRLDQDCQKGLVAASHVRSSILSAAFAGNLIPQDPSDEPAAALLERIAAERASFNGHKTTRARKPRTTRSSLPV